MKLPCGHIKVPPPLNGRSKAKRQKGDSSNSDQKHSDNGRGKTAKDATKELLKENEDEAKFCRSFVMLVLCTYIAPTTSLNINRNYYPSLMDCTKNPLMDWCGFIADYLIQGIEEFRSSSKSHVQVPGCVHILPLVYIDALINMKDLVLPEALSLPEGEPRIHFIGTDHLSYLASVDVKSRTKDRVEYGLLEESWRASTGVPPSSRQEFAGHMCGHDNSVPPTCGNKNNGEISAADFMRSLFNEIKENRQQIFQDFQIKIVESDRKIFSEFERKFSQEFTVSPKSRPMEENVMAPASPAPAKAGKCTTSNVPEEQEMMDNSHISNMLFELLKARRTNIPQLLPPCLI